ncbi:MAG: PAS domain-containing protein [Saccharofermentans sp.]|nr:PAS domain-containing protein [Saccharofermentans sp.]
MINQMLKSVIDMDRSSVVICNLNHTIVYMNPAAIRRYDKRGGVNLIGRSLLNCHNDKSNDIILQVVAWFEESEDNNMIYTFHNEKENKDVYMVALRDEDRKLIGYYEKHEYRDRETAKIYDFSKSLV